MNTVKHFTEADVNNGRIYARTAELIDAPTDWQRRGLQQTASGYGRKLNTGLKIRYCGRDYRLYATCFSNAATVWFTVKGQRIYVA